MGLETEGMDGNWLPARRHPLAAAEPRFVPVFGEHERWVARSGGAQRTPVFRLTGEFLRFRTAGFDRIDPVLRAGGIFLLHADGGEAVRAMNPPMSGDAAETTWFLPELVGERLCLEVRQSPSFAGAGFISLDAVRQSPASSGEPCQAYLCLEPPAADAGVWSVSRSDFAGKACAPYLRAADRGFGVAVSRPFPLGRSPLKLMFSGYCKPETEHKNRVEIVDAGSGEVLAAAYPPNMACAQCVELDLGAYAGRSVRVKLVKAESFDYRAGMGLEAAEGGPGFALDFIGGLNTQEWVLDDVPTGCRDIFGIPFLFAGDGEVSQAVSFPAGLRAERLLLAGMTVRDRAAFGSEAGRVELAYADGSCEQYPLVVGESLWWAEKNRALPEPFASFSELNRALAESMRLYPPLSTPGDAYLACIRPRDEVLVEIKAIAQAACPVRPAILGITAMVRRGAEMPEGCRIVRYRLPDEAMLRMLDDKALVPVSGVGPIPPCAERLGELLYSSERRFPGRFERDIPQDYRGPAVAFGGNRFASFYTNVFSHNLNDLAGKVDDAGVYHTSSAGAPWYGYDNIGGTYSTSFRLHAEQGAAGAYFGEAWTRDLGRSLMELTAFGYLDKALQCADWCLERARVWEEDPALTVDGRALPRHICRILQYPDPRLGGGCFENDGHALTALFIFQLWRRLPDAEAWLRPRWEDVRGLGDWYLWQFDHPEISRAGDTLWSDSEASGWPMATGASIFCDIAAMQALLALSRMADFIGEGGVAERWRALAGKFKAGVESKYADTLPDGTQAWSTGFPCGWGAEYQGIVPRILPCDLFGFRPERQYPEWGARNEAAYGVFRASYRPVEDNRVTVLGYHAAFALQAALLGDRMADASALLMEDALLIWNPFLQPYTVPEQAYCASADGKAFARIGDLGNGVQQAEILKALRIVLGIDDTRPDRPAFLPRLPKGWTGASVAGYPLLTERGGVQRYASLGMELAVDGRKAELSITADTALPPADIRLGPFDPEQTGQVTVTCNGAEAKCTDEVRGDTRWVRFTVPDGCREIHAVASV